MKRVFTDGVIVPDKKKNEKRRRHAYRRAKTPSEVFDILLKTTALGWFFVKEMLNMHLLPYDIGIVIMSLHRRYNCLECPCIVEIHTANPRPSLCVACYNMSDNPVNYGLLCKTCGPYILDECATCPYARCKVHSMFNTGDSRRCTGCETLICDNCAGNTECHEILHEGSESEEVDFCISCYNDIRNGNHEFPGEHFY